MPNLNKLNKVNETVSIYRYDNGWMVEVGGRDDDDEWVTAKVICNTEVEVLDLIKQYNTLPLVN
jgi:hypothetical protein